jgi:hypothetical protein
MTRKRQEQDGTWKGFRQVTRTGIGQDRKGSRQENDRKRQGNSRKRTKRRQRQDRKDMIKIEGSKKE